MNSTSPLDRIASPRRFKEDGASSLSQSLSTVFVVHSDALVRQLLEAAIEELGWEARAFASAAEFHASPPASGPRCLVLDVAFLGIARLDLHDDRGAGPSDMPMILASRCGHLVMTVSAVGAGSIELVKTPMGDGGLMAAVRYALERSRAVLEQQAKTRRLEARLASLSHREREVLALVVSGLLNKQVGYELGISEITVKAHRGRVMRKMQAGSLAELVNMAARLGIGGRSLWDISYDGSKAPSVPLLDEAIGF